MPPWWLYIRIWPTGGGDREAPPRFQSFVFLTTTGKWWTVTDPDPPCSTLTTRTVHWSLSSSSTDGINLEEFPTDAIRFFVVQLIHFNYVMCYSSLSSQLGSFVKSFLCLERMAGCSFTRLIVAKVDCTETLQNMLICFFVHIAYAYHRKSKYLIHS